MVYFAQLQQITFSDKGKGIEKGLFQDSADTDVAAHTGLHHLFIHLICM